MFRSSQFFICFSSYLSVFRIRHAINWSFTDSKNFSSTRSIFYEVCIIVCELSFIFFYLVIMEGCSVQTLFWLYRNLSATSEKFLPPLITQLSVSPRGLYSVANTLHLPRLPPPPTLIFLRPPYPWPLTPSTLVRRAWHQGTRDVGANNSLIIAPPPLTLVGGTGCRPSSTLPTVPVVATL